MTNAELAILGLIIEKPRHGYEIERVIEARGMRDWTEVGFSSIYYLLKKLEAAGFIEAVLMQQDGQGPARKIYQSTSNGYDQFRLACLDVLSRPQHGDNPFLLGLANLPVFNRQEALQALQDYRQALSTQMEQVAARAHMAQPLPPHVDLMFDYSLITMQAEINWLEHAIQKMETQNDRT